MNKKLKKFIQFFIALIIFLTTGNANAAIRYDFDRELSPLGGYYEGINHPIGDDGITPTLFKYIRVRFEPGSGYGDKIDVYAIASNSYQRIYLASLKGIAFSGNRSFIIDFKARNAPARSDATYTVNCNNVTSNGITYSTDDYCIANESYTYGIRIENKSVLGGNAKVYGGYSFEN
jgi:hypothetical protein